MSSSDNDPPGSAFTAFAGDRLIARGGLAEVARAAHAFADAQLIVFEDATGRVIDLDLRGSPEQAATRASPAMPAAKTTRGRPKLGVTAREVTLLPRHWGWLATQPGGASAALRRLVEEASRRTDAPGKVRQIEEAAYRVMTALAGNLPHYEEALRALFANDDDQLSDLTAGWPRDIATYVMDIASGRSGSPSLD